jgi:hypothetical protein
VARGILAVVVVVGRLAVGHGHRLGRRARRGGGGEGGSWRWLLMWLSLALSAGCVLVRTLKYLPRQLKLA